MDALAAMLNSVRIYYYCNAGTLYLYTYMYMIKHNKLEKDKSTINLRKTKQSNTNQVPRLFLFKEKLPPCVGFEPTTFSVIKG